MNKNIEIKNHDNKLLNKIIKNDLNIMSQKDNYYEHIISKIKKFIENKNVIELGCGTGNATKILLNYGANYILGIDKNNEFINQSLKKFENIHKLDFLAMDIEFETEKLLDLIKKNNIDTIFSVNFFEHINNDKSLIYKLYKMLPYKGKLISILPSSKLLYGNMDKAYHHFRRYDKCDISNRFSPFVLIYRRKSGIIRYFGWFLYKRQKYRGLKKPWDIYQYFLPFDSLLDNFFNKLLPLGANYILVHTKNKL